VSAFGSNIAAYPPVQNGKQKRGGLIMPADYAMLLTAAERAKLAGLQVPVATLGYAAATDLLSGAALTGGVWADVVPNQSFTATTGTVYLILVRLTVLVTAVASAGEMSTRALINGGAVAKLSGASYPAGGQAMAGTGAFILAGLTPGASTIKLQVYSSANASAYCRASTQPNVEFAEITILRISA
jgi:hypothetical protein